MKSNNEKGIYTILFAYILILFYFFFLKSSEYIEADEIVNVNIYLHLESLLLKNYPNNHILTSSIGIIIKKLFGVDILYFRAISFLSLLAIFLVFVKFFKNAIPLAFFIAIFSLSNYLFQYAFFYRGYYFSSLLFVFIFLFLNSYKNNTEDKLIKIILIILSFLLLGNITNLYLVLPIVISLFFFKKRHPFKIIFIYFIIPTLFLQSSTIFVTGIFDNHHLFKNFKDVNLEFLIIFFDNIYTIFVSGFNTIFNNSYINESVSFKQIKENYSKDFTILAILVLSLLISLYNLFIIKKKDILDFSIIYFFIIFILIFKNPPLRVHIGYIYYFIFYIFYNLNLEKYNKINGLKTYLFLIPILIGSLFFVSTHLDKDFPKKHYLNDLNENLFKNKNVQKDLINCKLTNEKLTEYNKQYFYYIYNKKCMLKGDFFEFYNFYKKKN